MHKVRITNSNNETLIAIAEGAIFGEVEAIEKTDRQFNAFAAFVKEIFIIRLLDIYHPHIPGEVVPSTHQYRRFPTFRTPITVPTEEDPDL